MASASSSLAGVGVVLVLMALTSSTKGDVLHALVGESVLLNCENISNIDNTTVVWKKHNMDYKQITYRETPQDGWASSILKLEQILLADSGDYECLVMQNYTVLGRKSFSLHVTVERGLRKPFIVPSSMNSNISVFANRKVMLRCNARSQEALYIKWYFQNQDLSKLKTGKVILEQKAITHFTSKLILGSESLQEGLYTCFVFNQYGTDSKSIYVQVKPVPPTRREDLATAYQQKYLEDEDVPLGVVIGIPVSILIIVLAAVLTVYERYSWRQSGRHCRGGQGSERRSVVKRQEVDIDKSENPKKKEPTNINGQVPRSSLQECTPVFQAQEIIEEDHDVSSISNKSSSSFRPDIDLEWEGVELRLPVNVSDDDDFTPKPSIALPEDDLSFSVPDDLWVLCEGYDTHRTRPVMLPKTRQLNNNATETIV